MCECTVLIHLSRSKVQFIALNVLFLPVSLSLNYATGVRILVTTREGSKGRLSSWHPTFLCLSGIRSSPKLFSTEFPEFLRDILGIFIFFCIILSSNSSTVSVKSKEGKHAMKLQQLGTYSPVQGNRPLATSPTCQPRVTPSCQLQTNCGALGSARSESAFPHAPRTYLPTGKVSNNLTGPTARAAHILD